MNFSDADIRKLVINSFDTAIEVYKHEKEK